MTRQAARHRPPARIPDRARRASRFLTWSGDISSRSPASMPSRIADGGAAVWIEPIQAVIF